MADQTHWYHCSDDWHGQLWTARRECPRHIGHGEPPVPRLCVAENVARCFAATVFTRDVFVYRTAKPRRANKPFDVHDAIITQERWLVPPVEMVWVETIQAGIVNDIYRLHINKINRTRQPPTIVDRLRLFARILLKLPDAHVRIRDVDFVEKALRYFEDKEVA